MPIYREKFYNTTNTGKFSVHRVRCESYYDHDIADWTLDEHLVAQVMSIVIIVIITRSKYAEVKVKVKNCSLSLSTSIYLSLFL